jgi:hypothetical protein
MGESSAALYVAGTLGRMCGRPALHVAAHLPAPWAPSAPQPVQPPAPHHPSQTLPCHVLDPGSAHKTAATASQPVSTPAHPTAPLQPHPTAPLQPLPAQAQPALRHLSEQRACSAACARLTYTFTAKALPARATQGAPRASLTPAVPDATPLAKPTQAEAAPRSACGAARRAPRRYGRDRCCPPRRSGPGCSGSSGATGGGSASAGRAG